MARFAGPIGFAHTVRTAPGVSSEVVTEKGPYYGDVKRSSMTQQAGDGVNPDLLRTSNSIEVVADDYASENIFAIRFVVWAGTPWTVAEVAVQRPRLLLRLGGVYHGDRDEAVPAPGTP